ncbi:protein SON [Corythoichthys intestinalis]|uniref:protein SON n=1 Tax=Corythoichthys intestinalis TaxID=161448 RepID=UPI0025A56A27|nr:protein SON [Corythoichthys intestinalis]
MAANIEQIFQDFILNKIREIEDQNGDKNTSQEAASCSEMIPDDSRDKKSDGKSSHKKHKKHKKHKSKKKKRNREKEARESSSESWEELDVSSRKEAKPDNEQPASSSRGHKHKTGKKKKKKRHKDEKRKSSDSDSEQRKSKCAESLLPRQCDELPDIIPKQDSSSGAKADEEKKGRSHSHSNVSHSNSEKWSSRPGKRKSRSPSPPTSQGHHNSSSSIGITGCLDPPRESKQDVAKDIKMASPSPKRSATAEVQRLDHNHKPAETTIEINIENSGAICASSPSLPKSSRQSHQTDEPIVPQQKESEQTSPGARKSPTKKMRKPSKSPPGNKEKSAKRRNRSRSPCRTHRTRSRSRSASRRKRSRSPRRTHRTRSRSRSSSRRKRSRSLRRTQRTRSRSRGSSRRKRSRSPCRTHRTRSRSRSSSRRKRSRSRSRSGRSRRSRSDSRNAKRRANYSQRDRWKREPSHSPVLILRKKRSPTWKHVSHPDGPQQITEHGKEQLLEIAKANAAAMCAKVGMAIPESLKSSMLSMTFPNMAMNAAMTAATMTAALSNINTLSSLLPLPSIINKSPGAIPTNPLNAAMEEMKKKMAKQANIISIKEFTDKCKMIVDSKGELPVALPHVENEEEDDGKLFGGSILRENKAISFNINSATVRPTARSDAGKAKEFPVSSGSQHRKKESKTLDAYGDWVPVEKTSEDTKNAVSVATVSSSSGSSEALKAPELPGSAEESGADDDNVFPDPPPQPVDISQAVSERIKAQKRLAENPYDVNAICMLSRAQEQVDAWAQSNTVPGLFTGSTGAQVLSSEELSNSGPQAWLKKDQFLKAAPVTGGVGEFLMKKMGWRSGEGLGRNREGTVEPIVIDFKVDRKGLLAEGEKPQKTTGGLVVTKDLMGKHPVSALIELCTKKRMTQPDFVMVHHSGPDHRKNFLFKVTVNGADYQPQTASPNKKHAKAMAATVALQALGEVPADGPGLYTGPVFTAASTGPLFST